MHYFTNSLSSTYS